MSDYILQIKVKNGPLMRAMRVKGWNAPRLKKESGCDLSSIYGYLSLKLAPLRLNGAWRKSIISIATALNTTPFDLFPIQHFDQPLKYNTAEINIDLLDIEMLVSETPEDMLIQDQRINNLLLEIDSLPFRRREIICRYFGLRGYESQTLKEIGNEFGITGVRVNQIQRRVISDLKHPAKACKYR